MRDPDGGPATTTGAPEGAVTRPAAIGDGVGGLLADRAFRGVAVANVLSAIAFGTSRFVFVWLIGELTEWNTATAILGVVIGLPPLLLSAWAGSLADRLVPRRLGLVLFAISAVLFGATALLVGSDLMTVPLAMACGLVTAIAPSMLMPLLQALVPAVVPPARLMQAVAIQNLGMMVSVIFGTFLGGAVIQLLGTAAGFWLLSIASAVGALAYARAPLPDRMAGAGTQRRGAIRDGIRIALGTEPLRSLLAMMGVLGLAITASALLLPELARDVLGQQSLAASALNAFMSVGMVVTSMVLATRWTPSRPGLVLVAMTSTSLGGGLVAIGLSRTYVLTALVALAWGMCGGIVMTLLRTLMQVNTPPELMGRVMGLSAMAQNGAFPIASVVLAGLVAATSVSGAMVISGLLCSVLIWLVAVPPHVRRL